jgi:hypothetical protein
MEEVTMSDRPTNETTEDPEVRHHKRVRFLAPGEIGVTLGDIEYGMQVWEAQMLACMIDDVIDDPSAVLVNGGRLST